MPSAVVTSRPAPPTPDARENIPAPKGLPILGNLLDLQDEVPLHAIERMVDIHGPIFKITILGQERITIASAELLEELCDEKRFWKTPGDALASLKRKGAPRSGLFSAPSEDSIDWQLAHRILMPAFGPLSIQQMFGEMHDIASQLVLKWARKGPSYRIPVTLDFTRLTLDTIALCGMGYRFNSFYQNEMHPYVDAMNTTLSASSDRLKVGSLVRKLLPWDKSAQQLEEARDYMREVAHELVQNRRDNPTDKHDLLNAMIHGKDPKTGETMDNDLISANMTTFLVAGHETTSGLLSFAMLNLLKNPQTYFKAQQEIDRVVGRERLTIDHLKDLHYITAVLRETLRLTPTAPGFSRSIRGDNPNDVEPLLGGKYAIRRSDQVLCLIGKAQRDPKVYGEDTNDFNPDRMLEENFQRLPAGAWKAFGTGIRACIGRAFAWQEAQMVLALMLQTFNFSLDDPQYQMRIKQTLTIKPEGFYMRATLREGITPTSLQHFLTGGQTNEDVATNGSVSAIKGAGSSGKPFTVIYGSNTGTCQSLAQKLSIEAHHHGFSAQVKEMNSAVGALPKDRPVIIIAASYEGQPTDNANQFIAWLESAKNTSNLDGVEYAVFGCGHSDWKSTFHRIPKLVDDLMQKSGGQRIAERGLTDAANNRIFSDFESWMDGILWPALAPHVDTKAVALPALEMQVAAQDRTTYLRQDLQKGTVVDARILTAPSEPEKRHLEVKLPQGQSYSTGDYLAILPFTPADSVRRAMKNFNIASGATITIKPGSATFLPTGVTISAADLLRGYVELGQPVTKKDLRACAAAAQDAEQKSRLESMLNQAGPGGITELRLSVLDILDQYPSIEMPFSTFVSMLPPLRPRHYSISSSPLHDPEKCTITYSIIDEASNAGAGRFIGVTSNYLSSLRAGDEVLVSVRATNKFFRLPTDPDSCPILLFGAGTGYAPFRGFLQERAVQKAAGRTLAPALLFLGCRSQTKDRLYADEIDAWIKDGVVDVKYAFSREPENSKGCKYVQDRMLEDKDDVLRMWRAGAKVFVCGGPEVSTGIGGAAKHLLMQSGTNNGQVMTEEEVEEWFGERRNERYVVDVFA